MIFAIRDSLQLTSLFDQVRVSVFESDLLLKQLVDLKAREFGVVVFTLVDFGKELDFVNRLLNQEANLHVVNLILRTQFEHCRHLKF